MLTGIELTRWHSGTSSIFEVMIRHFFFIFTLGCSVVGKSYGYGNAGHQAIGTIAEHYLTGTRAGLEIRTLLKPGEGLDRAATWADRAKIPDKYLTIEMKEFVANNPGHHSYHYCDVPFQEKAYREGITGTNPHDIVHTLRICIQVLQSKQAQPENPLRISKRVALMLIAHYIGDLHQPLHVGCSYVDEQNHFVNPEKGVKGQPDAGGNHFQLTKNTKLHGYWDTQTVKLAHDHAGKEDFTTFIVSRYPAKPDWNAKGPINTWPEQWATETLGLAEKCFAGITLGERFLVPKDEKSDEHFEWKITLPTGYDEKSRDIVEVELAKAGYRLAALLKAIWPDPAAPHEGK